MISTQVDMNLVEVVRGVPNLGGGGHAPEERDRRAEARRQEDVQREAAIMNENCEAAARRLAELEKSSTASTQRADAREAALAASEATTEDLKAGAALQTTAVADLSGRLAAANGAGATGARSARARALASA